jgi:hypothetical protein
MRDQLTQSHLGQGLDGEHEELWGNNVAIVIVLIALPLIRLDRCLLGAPFSLAAP